MGKQYVREPRFFALENIVEVVLLNVSISSSMDREPVEVLIESIAALDKEGIAWQYRVNYKKPYGRPDDQYRRGTWQRAKINREMYNKYVNRGEAEKIDPLIPARTFEPRSRIVKAFVLPADVKAPDCICGAVMEVKQNRATRALFWGCGAYPYCKKTIRMPLDLEHQIKSLSKEI